MDPLIESPYRFQGFPYIFVCDFMDPLTHYMHPLIYSIEFLTDVMDPLIDLWLPL